MQSRAQRRFTDSAIGRAVNHRHTGNGWAERHLEATNFGMPVQTDQRTHSRRTEPTGVNEYHGATHTLVMSVQFKAADPAHPGYFPPHGLPPGYEHPQRLGPDVLDPGGPRILPVTQEIEHGPELSRSAEFQEAAELGAYHTTMS